MGIKKDIKELIEAGVIDEETGSKISNFYAFKENPKQTNRLFIVFGILGSILVALGIILIIAHNWDNFPRLTKTFFAFLPLLIGQIACGYTLVKQSESITWRESSAAFLFFAVASSISMVSQIYNIPGNINSFMLTWMLLIFPLIYMMRSSFVSLFYIIGITYYTSGVNYWSYPSGESHWYWILLLLIIPHYYQLYKTKPNSNFMIFHNWVIPSSIIITLGTLASSSEEFMLIAYFSLFGLLYLTGNLDYFKKQNLINNGYRVLGSIGTISLLLSLSFNWFWEEISHDNFNLSEEIISIEALVALLITALATVVLISQWNQGKIDLTKPMELLFLVFILTFFVGLITSAAMLIINLIILATGIMTIRLGAKENHLGVLNYGLLIITALIFCRFFDTQFSFVIRGILFVMVGVGFFLTNYWLLKKRRANG